MAEQHLRIPDIMANQENLNYYQAEKILRKYHRGQ